MSSKKKPDLEVQPQGTLETVEPTETSGQPQDTQAPQEPELAPGNTLKPGIYTTVSGATLIRN